MTERSKKIALALAIISALFLFQTVPHVLAIDNTVPVADSGFQSGVNDPCKGKTDCYSPFSGFADALGTKFTTLSEVDSLGSFINAIIALGIGLGGILAVVMIMYQGFLYMKTDNVNTKTETKNKIINTVIGFVLLLSIFTILKTINPDLLNLTPGITNANITQTPDNTVATDVIKPNNPSIPNSGVGYAMKGTYDNPTPDSASQNFTSGITALKNGATISSIIATVSSASKSGTMKFNLSDGTSMSTPIRTGWQGVAEIGQGVSGDNKTPKGSYVLGGKAGDGSTAPFYTSKDQQNAVLVNGHSYGAAFFGINIDPNGKNRYIGVHGQDVDTLGTTNGCLRVHNAELVMLIPYMKAGIPLTIN
jgi:hypothetical protein